MAKSTLYVAETNGDGHIEWVWVALRGRGAARPFDASAHQIILGSGADFSGARPEAIVSWMAARKHTVHAEDPSALE